MLAVWCAQNVQKERDGSVVEWAEGMGVLSLRVKRDERVGFGGWIVWK